MSKWIYTPNKFLQCLSIIRFRLLVSLHTTRHQSSVGGGCTCVFLMNKTKTDKLSVSEKRVQWRIKRHFYNTTRWRPPHWIPSVTNKTGTGSNELRPPPKKGVHVMRSNTNTSMVKDIFFFRFRRFQIVPKVIGYTGNRVKSNFDEIQIKSSLSLTAI